MHFALLALSLLATSSVVSCLSPPVPLISSNFTVGYRLPGDEEIVSEQERVRGSPNYVVNYARTFSCTNEHQITQVIVEEGSQTGALAAIIAGGPGQTFVTLYYTVPRRGQTDFLVKIYGKGIAFRKIP